ncbi:MAG: endonuclease/exonuclease/phosphatase family protein, partial [Pseudomonadota bacterium]
IACLGVFALGVAIEGYLEAPVPWYGRAGLAAAGVGVALLAGQAGALHPLLDGLGHLRAHFAVGAVALAGLAGAARAPRLAAAAALVSLFGMLTMALTPPHATGSAAPAALRLMTFNTLHRTDNVDEAERLLRSTAPDIVVWQEYQYLDQALGPRILDLYPHQIACDRTKNCGVALFSQKPWAEAGIGKPEATGRVSTVWARFEPRDGPAFTVMGVHPRKPDRHGRQRQDYDILKAQAQTFGGRGEPLIVAGDFNATPWSYVMRDFSRATGLRWTRHFAPTYSAKSPSLFQIDHIMTSDAVHVRSITRKPASGSDHYPLLAELVLTGEAPSSTPQAGP